MGNQFDAALDSTEAAQKQYGQQLGFVGDRTPFAAETMPDRQVAVDVNGELMQEVASHIVNRAGHVSIIDEHGAGKSHFRDIVYESLNERRERFRVARIQEVESITTRRTYVRVLNDLRQYNDLDVPEQLPHATDEVREALEDLAEQLEDLGVTCIVQVDQMEDVAGDTNRFEQLLAALQSIGDLGDKEPVFILFLFGTHEAGDRIEELRETLASRMVAKDRTLERFSAEETEELIGRWLSWARDEEYTMGYPIDPFAPKTVRDILNRVENRTPRAVRQECYHAYRAGARQYEDVGTVEITPETLEARL
jgi:type II secretory pathway predicted ATPase ExeA